MRPLVVIAVAVFLFITLVLFVNVSKYSYQNGVTVEPTKKPEISEYSLKNFDVYEWQDNHGRSCTLVEHKSGRESSLDCDFRL